MSTRTIDRRRFLGGMISAAGFPLIVPSRALGRGGDVPPSDRIVLAHIGVGQQGSGHVRYFASQADVHVAAICDVRLEHREQAKRVVDTRYGDKGCALYSDFREVLARPDIDAVCIAVPDHWHVLIGQEAARRGKDMYSEKPIGVSIAEGKALREVVKSSGVVFQFGTQQRSDRNFRYACELVRNGLLGTPVTIMLGAAGFTQVPMQPTQPVPPGFDYNFWLGPAPVSPHCELKCTRQFTLLYDYSLGCLGGAWGVHDTDIAQWAANADHSGPVDIEGTGTVPSEGFYDTVQTWYVEQRYADGTNLINMDGETALKRFPEQFRLIGRGVAFKGPKGWVAVSRSGIYSKPESLIETTLGPNDFQLPHSNDHHRNFINAVRTRTEPISPIEAAVRSDTVCHQADLAVRLKRRLHWDPEKEEFIGDEEANRLLVRSMRTPWTLS